MVEFDVVGFGALNVDKLFKVSGIAGKDEESFVVGYHESCGGSAANTIVGLARLGLNTGFVGKVADDREGQLLLDSFREENVDTKGIVVAKRGRSGVVMGFVDEEGERALYVAPGVNDTINLEEIKGNYVKRTKFLHLTSFVGNKSFETQKKLVGQLPKHVKVSFDPGALYARKGLAALKPIVKRVFALFPNEAELKLLTGEGYKTGAEKLIDEGVRIVAVKLGMKGCFVTDGEENHIVESFKVEVVDTTGAGDAWNTGFLYGLLNGNSLRECGRIGNFVASRCVIRMGARTGLPRSADLQQFF
jgi:ribokinase